MELEHVGRPVSGSTYVGLGTCCLLQTQCTKIWEIHGHSGTVSRGSFRCLSPCAFHPLSSRVELLPEDYD